MNKKKNEDQYYLELLSIFYYIVAGLAVLIGCFPFVHLAFGFVMAIFGGFAGGAPPALFGLFFIIISGSIILFCWALAVFLIMTAKALVNHENYTFCLVVAGIACLFWPFGTALGIATIVVLLRPSVKEKFGVEFVQDNDEDQPDQDKDMDDGHARH